jgi:hypothetical protein
VTARTGLLSAPQDRRRFVYCVFGALALHALGAFSHRLQRPRVVVENLPPAPIFPVSLDDALPVEAPVPPPPAAPPEPPAAAPVVAAKDDDAPAPAKPPLPAVQRPAPLARSVPPAPSGPRRSDDAQAFGGERGAFGAAVCFLPKDTRSVRALERCKVKARFRTNAINVPARQFKTGFPGVERRVDWFGIDYRGRFKVRAGGYYMFRLISDDGAVLYVDGNQVIDNDGLHGEREAKMALPLTKGEHEFRLLYYQGPGSSLALQLFVKGYKTAEKPFGPEF